MVFTQYIRLISSLLRINLFTRAFGFYLAVSLLWVFTYSGTALAVDNERLLHIEGTSFDVFKISDDMAFPASKKIYIEDVKASFSKAWMSKFKSKTSESYRDKTLHDYAQAFQNQLAKKLTGAGWQVTDDPEETAMRVRTVLSNLEITAPDMLLISSSLVLYIGSSTFELSILDANEQALLYIQDVGVASSISSSFVETDNAMNFARFNKLFGAWANNFTVLFDMVSDLTPEKNG